MSDISLDQPTHQFENEGEFIFRDTSFSITEMSQNHPDLFWPLGWCSTYQFVKEEDDFRLYGSRPLIPDSINKTTQE